MVSSEIFHGSPIFTGLAGNNWSKGRLSPTAVTSSNSSHVERAFGGEQGLLSPDNFHANQPALRP